MIMEIVDIFIVSEFDKLVCVIMEYEVMRHLSNNEVCIVIDEIL